MEIAYKNEFSKTNSIPKILKIWYYIFVLLYFLGGKTMEIPKQLVVKVEEQADKFLTSFFYKNFEKNEFPIKTFAEAIEIALSKALTEDSPNIKEIRAAQVRSRRRKKKRWEANVKKDYKTFPINNPQNPFYPAYFFDETYPGKFQTAFDASDLNEYIQNVFQDINHWSSDTESYLLQFPLNSYINKTHLYKFFLNDVLFMALNILDKKYNGQINTFFRHRPNILLDTPVFDIQPKKHPLTLSSNGQLLANFVTGNGTLVVQVNGMKLVGAETYKIMDERDESIISSLVASTGKDFYSSKTVVVDLGSLLKSVYSGKKPGAKTYKEILDRLHRLANVRYTYEEPGKGKYTFGILDTVQDQIIDGKHTIRITFSERLYDEVIKQNTIKVTKDSFEQLTTPMARLLYPSLQRERINLTLKNQTVTEKDHRLINTYDQLFFARSILMNPKSKQKNAVLIQEALDDFVTYQVAVESYKMITKDKFQVIFFPLSPEERFDLKIEEKQNHVCIEKEKEAF